MLSEPRQVIWWYDEDAWSKALNYSDARLHYEKDGHLEFVHSMTGVRTLKDEFDKTASHNEHHLSQIRRALNLTGR